MKRLILDQAPLKNRHGIEFELVEDLIHLGHWELDLSSGRLTASAQCKINFGREPDEPFSYEELRAAIHPDDLDRQSAAVASAIESQSQFQLEYRLYTPSQDLRWVEIRGQFRQSDADAPQLVGISLDITERKQREERDNFLVALTDALRRTVDAMEVLDVVSRMLGSHLNAGRCGYGEVDDADNFTVERDWTNGKMPTLVGTFNLHDFGNLAQEFHAGRTVRIGYAPDEAVSRDAKVSYAEARETVSGVGVPLVKGGRLVAVLFVHERKARAWADAEVALIEDVAERTWETLERARAEQLLREANRAKDDFLAMLGHELRNPLAPIVTALQLMRMRQPDVLVREREIMASQVRHMVALVDDLLDVSRITRGKIELQQAPVELADIVARSIETADPLFDKYKQIVETDIEHGLLVNGDVRRLVQVVTNLLTNAAKYSPPQRTIRVTARAEGDEAILSVRDQGYGIEPDLKPRIFELFTQSTQAIDRAEGGLGLGLALVHNLVTLHGGSVEALSGGRNCGSEFVVRLPRMHERPPEDRKEAAPAPAMPQDAAKPTVLVVDDYADAADSIAELLAMGGYPTQVAYDGPTALEAAAEYKPAIALVDIGLPAMDGYEVARRLRAMPGLENLVLVAVTGYGQESDRRRAKAAGFDEHLVKPLEPATLAALLDELRKGRG
ncbi:MAG TPA: ATP-binding protein [Gammaproteobacteria bacterium]|nr:ATP-binding protein [Gammaproteobacteria bacterium]